ncbi:hypothetical protein M9H77_12302 [Catharanthus roseus]|uniref:Uncharacterized protein n=1 Tax=Catharanthus roseus TaxID=4058 RepID=A0ACC0BH75_CATRO|nr:hypothetical protein M9H77_12302 [Catharanthus roseus]
MPEFQGLQRRGMPKYTPRINASYKYPTASDSQVGNPDSYTLFEKTNLDLDMLTVCLENMQRSFKIHSIAFACCKEALKIIRVTDGSKTKKSSQLDSYCNIIDEEGLIKLMKYFNDDQRKQKEEQYSQDENSAQELTKCLVLKLFLYF